MSNGTTDFEFTHQLRVRFAEADLQGFVFNPNYLMYCDVVWTEYFRSLGFTYDEMVKMGVDSVLKSARLDFDSPARFDDVLILRARVSQIGRTSMTFDFEIRDGGDERLIARVASTYVFINPQTSRPTAVPDNIRAVISEYEHKDFSARNTVTSDSGSL